MNKEELEKRIEEFIEESGLTKKEIQNLVDEKKQELKGLISDEGALFVIAKELGIDSISYNKEIKEEIKDLTEEIQEDNPELKEILDIMKTKEYKLWFTLYTKVGKQLIDYAIEKNLFSIAPGETKKIEKPLIEFIEVKKAEELDNSWKVYNDKNQIAFIGKSLIEKVEQTPTNTKLYISDYKNAKAWLPNKIDWKEEQQ